MIEVGKHQKKAIEAIERETGLTFKGTTRKEAVRFLVAYIDREKNREG